MTRVVFCCLNGSTADAERDDPSLRRMMGFARRLGAETFEPRGAVLSPCGTYRYSLQRGDLTVVNVFAFRSTKWRALLTAPDPVGPDNDAHIRAAAAEADLVIAAWGGYAFKVDPWRVRFVEHRLLARGRVVHCLGVTADRHPRHPLYLPQSTPLDVYLDRGAAP